MAATRGPTTVRPRTVILFCFSVFAGEELSLEVEAMMEEVRLPKCQFVKEEQGFFFRPPPPLFSTSSLFFFSLFLGQGAYTTKDAARATTTKNTPTLTRQTHKARKINKWTS